MEIPPSQKQNRGHAQPNGVSGQTSRQFKGIRLREWGKWVSEIRIPRSRDKIYLGSYRTAEQAARAFDAAMYCLKGPNAKFNFPDSVPAIPSAFSLSPQQIQVAASKYALNEILGSSPPLQSNSIEEPSHPSQSSSVSDVQLSNGPQHESEDSAFWNSLFAEPESVQYLNLEKIPSMDEELALELIPTSHEEEVDISVEPIVLWNFEDS